MFGSDHGTQAASGVEQVLRRHPCGSQPPMGDGRVATEELPEARILFDKTREELGNPSDFGPATQSTTDNQGKATSTLNKKTEA